MSREKFIATEYAQRISDCKDRLFALYSENGYEGEGQEVKALLSKISGDDMIRVVFIGQYTAGKSTIISALTGNNSIKIDSDIATDHTSDYNWSDGVILTDTPGLYTENPEHSNRTIEMIRQSDLLVYCITSDLFNQYTKADFERWAFDVGYFGKMFLVVNKMSKESGDYPALAQNYTKTINCALSPHSMSEFPHSFVDAKDYRDGISDNDTDLIEFSHFEEFIAQLNNFVLQKGHLGRLDTPIKILKSSIDKVAEMSVDTEQERAYYALLSRIEKRVDQRRSQVSVAIHSCISRGLKPITDKGYELSRSIGVEDVEFTDADFNELVEATCESINHNLDVLIDENIQALNEDISDIMQSDTASFFFNAVGGTVSGKKHLFESRQAKVSRAQFDAISDIVNQITGKTVSIATKGGKASAEFFIKSSEAAGSQLHTAVKFIGGKLGYKFKPWQAANIAKKIGNVAKFAGPAISVLSFFFDVKETIDESERSQRIIQEQIKYRQTFIEVSNDLERQYSEHTDGLFSVYKNIADEITANRTKVQQMMARNDNVTKELHEIKSDLKSIQDQLF